MPTLFLACAILGGGVLVLQLVLGLAGVAHDHDLGGHDVADGFNLLSVRTLAAGAAFFGIAGRGALAAGVGAAAALPLALLAGGAAAFGVAALMRGLRNLESDGAVRIDGAIGLPARVHVRVPGERGGAGKVLLTLQNRLVELQAVTARTTLPTGTPVIVVDVVAPDTVEVVATPDLEIE